MYYVYILQSQKNLRFYTGLTKNLSRRLSEHNAGQVKPTKGYRPYQMVYSEKVGTLARAREREKFLKTGTGRKFRDNFLKNNIPR